jgi:hypothetical protein
MKQVVSVELTSPERILMMLISPDYMIFGMTRRKRIEEELD